MITRAKEGRLNVSGVSMDYIMFGNGPKNLVMIQGLNTRGIKGAAASLAFLYRIFKKDYTVYLFDRRTELREDITIRELAADVATAMDALELDRADVFGVSQGGMIAQYLAIDRPDLVEKLVLAVTLSRNNEIVRSVITRWIDLTVREDWNALVRDMAENMYSDAYVRRYRPLMPLLALLQKPKDRQRFLILARSCLTCDAYAELEKVQCPVLVIGGQQDRVVGGQASVEIAEKLGCECFLYEDLGHAAYEEAKDFNERVLRFLKDSAE